MNIKNVWEDISNFLEKDFFEINEENNILNNKESNLENNIHASAADQDKLFFDKFENICLSDTYLCDKIKLIGNYTNKERYEYTNLSFETVWFIWENAVIWWNFEWKINEIQINKNMWNRRWYATREDIIISLWTVKSLDEFQNLITHELWHIFDLWYIQWKSKKKHWSFTEFDKEVFAIDDISLKFYNISRNSEKTRKKDSSKKDFCSWYWMYDPFEDFSECFNLFLNHNGFFKTAAQKNSILKSKYNFIAAIFDGNYIKDNKSDKLLLSQNTSWRPRDTTRINNK